MASFESINYSVRPNKNIERKLIFEGLQCISEAYSLRNHIYVGMGSMWFADFVMAHRQLQISEMISFELPEFSDRAEFNRPYSCIKVVPGDTTTQLPRLNWVRPMVIWLDYDSDFTGPLFHDLPLVANNAVAGTVLAVTINGHVGRVPTENERGEKLSRPDAIKGVWDPYIPRDLQITAKNYANIAGRSMLNILKEGLRLRAKGLGLLPLFHFFYADGAPMITVGGIVVNETELTQERIVSSGAFLRCPFMTGETQYIISAPPLTQREKQALDKLMPSSVPPSELIVQSKYGFTLPQKLLDEYHKFYRLYPNFTEVVYS